MALKDFGNLRPQVQALIVLGIAAGGLALFWYMVLAPIAQENAAKQANLDQLNQQIVVAEQRAAQLAQIRAETEALEARLAGLTEILPLERETAEILEELRIAAEAVGMGIVSFVPQAVVERDLYSEWPWDFEVRSTYHNMGLFLDRIRTIPRIVNVPRVVLNAQGDGATTSLSASFTATTFVYREEGELPPAEAVN